MCVYTCMYVYTCIYNYIYICLLITHQYPDGYLEAQKGASNISHDSDEEVRTSKKGGRKRKNVTGM